MPFSFIKFKIIKYKYKYKYKHLSCLLFMYYVLFHKIVHVNVGNVFFHFDPSSGRRCFLWSLFFYFYLFWLKRKQVIKRVLCGGLSNYIKILFVFPVISCFFLKKYFKIIFLVLLNHFDRLISKVNFNK
jgi:hypothetical protein